MTTSFDYAEANGIRFVEQLKDLIRIPSVSTMDEHHADVRRAAEWLRDHALEIGMSHVEVLETPKHPIVYAEWLGAGEGVPTVLVYGHYDVQPADDPNNEWKTEPFEPVEKDGHLYARGACDDKGQMFIHFKAIEAMLAADGALPINIKMVLEGEEESGSHNLPQFIRDNAEKLKADMVVLSDTMVLSETQPSIIYGLRGMVLFEIVMTGPNRDLHSGMFGGLIHNPAQALIEMVAKMHDENGTITIPGFYDDYTPLTDAERKALAAIPWELKDIQRVTGVSDTWGEAEYTHRERVGARPTLEVNGFLSGWTGQGGKTIIPARAMVKLSCRLAAHQDDERIFKLIQDYVAANTPPTVTSTVTKIGNGAPAMMVPIDSPPMKAAAAAYQAVYGVEPVFMREGGSIPVLSTIQEVMGIPVVMIGFGLDDDNLHSPNEKFTLSQFHKGIQTMLHFYQSLPDYMDNATMT